MDPLLEEIVRSRPEALMSESRPDWAQGKERVGGFQSVQSPEMGARRFAAPTPGDARANVRGTVQDTALEPAANYAKAFFQYLSRALVGKPEERLDTEADVRKKSYEVGEGFFNPVSGMVGMLAGKGAVGAPLDKLKKAMEAEAKGMPSQDIWRKYGWERGKDSLWRWEISDDGARLSPAAQDVLAGGKSIVGQPLRSVYEHPELYRAYPSLADVPASLGKGERAGSYMPRIAPGGAEISAISRDPTAMLRALTHEGQHGVQDIERFGIGGSPSTISQGEKDLARSRPLSVEDVKDPAMAAYFRRSGEVEARNAEARLSDADLRAFAPSVTEDVPRMLQTVRFLQETSPQLAVKEKGGMWHPEAVERLSAPLADKLEEARLLDDIDGVTPREVPWATRAIRNYLNKHAGTVTDPLKDVEIPFGEGVKRWEEVTDSAIEKSKIRKNKDLYNFGELSDKGKLEEDIFSFARGDFATGEARIEAQRATQSIESYLSHVGDYLRQNVASEKLQQYDLVRAVKETVANDARVAKEMEKAVASSTKDLPVYKEYPDGMKWVELKMSGKLTSEQAKGVRRLTREEIEQYSRESSMSGGDEWNVVKGQEPYVAVDTKGKPVYNSYTSEPAIGASPERAYLAGQLAQEGNQMGHCVGGYCEGVASGKSRIFSLRDGKGRSHVTVEVAPPGNMRGGYSTAGEKLPSSDAHILQIKGKQNRAPVAEYLPYVQDFVRSGKWGKVGDLPNTGLRRNRKTGEYKTDAELLKDNPNFRYNHEWD